MNRLSPLHWSGAASGALICHMVLALSWQNAEPPKLEKSAGAPIELVGSLASLTGMQTLSTIEPAEVIRPLETVVTTEQPITKAKPLLKNETITALSLVDPEPLEKQPPKKLKVKPPEKAQLKKPKDKTKIARKAKKKQRKQVAKTRMAALQKGGGAKGRKKKRAGRAAMNNFKGRIQSHLARYKRKPKANARGTVVVSFTILSSGRATSIKLARRSGNSAVDKAALSMVRRASPFPRIPAGGPRSMRFSVPLRFR